MAQTVKGSVAPEMDTNELFEKYTIEEIRDIEKKTRTNIEKKKEDLRMMVGERYRDLIEAADTITEMKNSSENVMQSIEKMQNLCQKMKQNHMVKGFNIVSRPRIDLNVRREENQFYAIASQIKLLLDMPEKIWCALDSRAYLRASQMYLLSRYVHTSMQVSAGSQTTRILSCFPVLARTWAAISHFREVILQACKDRLKSSSLSDMDAAECLCSLLLLEDSSPKQVFNDYLTISTSAVQHLFQTDETYMSVKDQICAVVKMIVRTIHQIFTVFGSGDDKESGMKSNLLMNILAEVTDKGDGGAILKDDSSPALKHLPMAVREFRPSLHHSSPVDNKVLLDNSAEWVKVCVQTVSTGLNQLLSYINSVKNLSVIRFQVWEILNNDSRLATWDVVCLSALQRKLSIWEEFFQPYFLKRTKELLQLQFDNALGSCKQQIMQVLGDLNSKERSILIERDVSSYVWVEGASDMPANMAWVTIGNKVLTEAGTLAMKARAYTPAIQNLSRNFDNRLKTLLEDGGHYLKPGKEEKVGAFDQYADSPVVLFFIQETCSECIHKLLEYLQTQLLACQKQEEFNSDHTMNVLILDRALLLGRLSSALPKLCIHLHKCMAGTTEDVEPPRSSKRPISGRGHSKYVDHPKWNEVKEKLAAFNEESFRFWAQYVGKHLAKKYKDVISDCSGQAIMRANTRWDEIDIEEETEDGKTIKSKIRVPMRPSWYLTSILYELCEEINRVGGHAIPRSVLQNLMLSMTDSIITAYEDLTFKKNPPKDSKEMPMTQNHALQLVFDIKILTNVISRKEDSKENRIYQKRVQAVIDSLEGHVDPFDLDVFSPHISTHLQRHTQRLSVLFGSLISLDKHGMYLTQRPANTTQHEQHNILPLSANPNRLPLLPLSVQHRQPLAPTIIQPTKSKSTPLLAPSSPPPEIPIPRNETTGFLANMSTLWFSNVTKK